MHFTTLGFAQDVVDQWKLTLTRLEEWIKGDLFTTDWWVLLVLFLLCAYLWWKAANNAMLPEYLIFTAVVVIMILVLDELGEDLSLWYYNTDIIPLFPPMSSIDFSCLPLLYLLMYKYARTWKAYLITAAVMSAIFCFVFEPLFIWSGVYKLLIWQSWWGLPLYFLIAVAAKAFTRCVYKTSDKKAKV